MSGTVIDSLVVLLGLDASNYRKGRETAEKETSETARKAKESADAITKSLTEVGRTIAGLFLGFETATGFAKWLGGLAAGEAALGRTASNLNMSGHELNRWGHAVELAGGNATDAQAAFTQLTDEAQKFFVTGEASPLINTLRQYGVNIKDANGNLRNQGEVFEELADKTAIYGRQYQNFALKQAGLSQGEINYLALSKQKRKELNDEAERSNGVTAQSIAQAQKLEQEWKNVTQEITAAGQAVVKDLAPAVLGVLHTVSNIVSSLKFVHDSLVGPDRNSPEEVSERARIGKIKYAGYLKEHPEMAGITKTPEQVAQEAADKIYPSGINPSTGGRPLYVPPASSIAARNNNPGNIQDKAGNKLKFESLEKGEDALENDLRIKMRRGLKTVDAIIAAYEGNDSIHNNIPAYIADVRAKLGKNELSESDIRQLALAISAHETAGGKIVSAPAGNNSTTTVQVDKIEVHSNSADPRAVADQVGGAIQRKVTVSQSDTGQS